MGAAKANDGDKLAASSRHIPALLSATTETLRLISAHPGDLKTVFHGILAKAAELCGGAAGSITLNDGGSIRYMASHGPAMEPYVGTTAPAVSADANLFALSPAGAWYTDDFAATTKSTAYFEEIATVARVRSYAAVPLTHDGDTVGAVHMYRHEVRPFTEDELTALATFGEQASLAVANARLFKDLGESLKLQTATSEVLALISAHPGDLTAVLNGLIERAVHLCDADAGIVCRLDGEAMTFLANPVHPESVGTSRPIAAAVVAQLRAGQTLRVDDMVAAGATAGRDVPSDVRSFLVAGLHVDGESYGLLGVNRHEVRLFDDREANILNAFAEQAAIAIGNANLFNDLDESLARQRAMTDVLDAVSTARTDLSRVAHRYPFRRHRHLLLHMDSAGSTGATYAPPPSVLTRRSSPPRCSASSESLFGFVGTGVRLQSESVFGFIRNDRSASVGICSWRARSEVFPLQWSNVDLEAATVRLEVGTTKNSDGRLIYLTDELQGLLRVQWQEHQAHHEDCPYVFHRNGKRIRYHYVAWRSACEKAELVGSIPHDFRRTAVRNMVRAGIPERVAMQMAGHKTRSVLDRYHIVAESDLREAAQKLNGALATRVATDSATNTQSESEQGSVTH